MECISREEECTPQVLCLESQTKVQNIIISNAFVLIQNDLPNILVIYIFRDLHLCIRVYVCKL